MGPRTKRDYYDTNLTHFPTLLPRTPRTACPYLLDGRSCTAILLQFFCAMGGRYIIEDGRPVLGFFGFLVPSARRSLCPRLPLPVSPPRDTPAKRKNRAQMIRPKIGGKVVDLRHVVFVRRQAGVRQNVGQLAALELLT